MRAKLQIQSVTIYPNQETIEAAPVGGKSGTDGVDEDNTYSKWTPSGKLTLTITNPALHGKFKPGQKYYADFTLAE